MFIYPRLTGRINKISGEYIAAKWQPNVCARACIPTPRLLLVNIDQVVFATYYEEIDRRFNNSYTYKAFPS